MEYGKRIKALREAKKISIYRLSQDSGISQGHISDLENGINQPTIETLKRNIVQFREKSYCQEQCHFQNHGRRIF